MPKPNVTMQEIADRLGVSLKSVSLAVNGAGRLSQKTRERIRCWRRSGSWATGRTSRRVRW